MTDKLLDSKNWHQTAIDHLSNQDKFKDYHDVSAEAARMMGAEIGSDCYDLLHAVAFAAAHLGAECGSCGDITAPLVGKWACCKSCVAQGKNEED